ncbi:MAG: DUF3842 family protein [Eubacteriales bacterium]
MRVYIIDGQGGGVGKTVIEKIRAKKSDLDILAIGCNSLATSAMLRAGAKFGATGENAIVYNSKVAEECDVIMGAVGIVCANSFHGELSEKMASAISQSKARKILIPTNKCNVFIGGTYRDSLNECIDQAVTLLFSLF